MIRKATEKDIDGVVKIYDQILACEERGEVQIGWVRNVYPTEKTARCALQKQDLFVDEENGMIRAAARINQEQVPEYRNANWEYPVPDCEVMVLHTLVVSPFCAGKGIGTGVVKFYENYALEHGCHYLRIDTNERNKTARKMYARLGYAERGIVPCCFNGIEGVGLVCLEKKV